MKKIKVMPIFGTRPDAIKMAPLVAELKKEERIETVVCVSAQHRQMLDTVLAIFHLTPDYDLNIMKDRQTLTEITANVLTEIDEVLNKEKPDIVLVHGDTTTAFTAALAAFYHKIKIGHVEAGLRTYDKYSPFPEEINRQFVGLVCDSYFAPTTTNVNNLLGEKVPAEHIFMTGNTEVDAIYQLVEPNYTFKNPLLQTLDYENKRVILMTAHRRENLGEPLENICSAVREIIETYPDVEVVYPVHLNPVVGECAHRNLGDLDRVHLIDPLEVDDMHNLMSRCHLVLTDSGGVQEDAPALSKPCLVLRTETERPEAVETGAIRLAGVEKTRIVKLTKELLDCKDIYDSMVDAPNPYGDGKASRRIVDAILYEFGVLDSKPQDYTFLS